MALCEYTAKYNLGYDVPWTNYTNCENNAMIAISESGRGSIRPSWELIYNHYVQLKKLYAPWSAQYADSIRPEGGGGNYGTSSGGFDQLGFGTLTFTLDTNATSLSPNLEWAGRKQTISRREGVIGRAIRYTLARDAAVSIRIYNSRGTLWIKTGRCRLTAGHHLLRLSPIPIPPGLYYAELSIDEKVIRRSFTLIP